MTTSLETERTLLGTMLQSEEAVVEALSLIKPIFFADKRNETLTTVIASLLNQGVAVDLLTVSREVEKQGVVKRIGGLSYLASLTGVIPVKSHVADYCRIIAEKYKSRRLINLSGQLKVRCESGESIDEVVEEVGQEFFSIVADEEHVSSISDSVDRVYAAVEKRCEVGESDGLMTGYYDLDKMTAGFRRGELIIIAARPGMGKTALVMNILQNMAVRKTPSHFFSLEMGADELTERTLSTFSGAGLNEIRRGYLNDITWPKVNAAKAVIKDLPILIDDTAGLSITELAARAQMQKWKHGSAIIAVDYLQLMTGTGQSRAEEIGSISRGLKKLAKSLEVPIIALSQLNRGLENRDDKRPKLSDLKSSGDIEQDADKVIFVYRDEIYNPQTADRNKAELIVEKQRNGPTGKVSVRSELEFARFRNFTEEV